jgi:hypothetical protein
MPELPEVESLCRRLNGVFVGQSIAAVKRPSASLVMRKPLIGLLGIQLIAFARHGRYVTIKLPYLPKSSCEPVRHRRRVKPSRYASLFSPHRGDNIDGTGAARERRFGSRPRRRRTCETEITKAGRSGSGTAGARERRAPRRNTRMKLLDRRQTADDLVRQNVVRRTGRDGGAAFASNLP